MENKKVYRLRYIEYYIKNNKGKGLIDWPCIPFTIPEGMSEEEAFEVLSYLTDSIEKKDEVKECSCASVMVLDEVLNKERFGFKKVNEVDENKITDLFTVGGRFSLFQKSELYKKYFNWYSKDIKKSEIEEIYDKIGMKFQDIKWLKKDDSKTKVLKK